MGHPWIHHLLLISLLSCQIPAVSGLFEWLRKAEPTAAAKPEPPKAEDHSAVVTRDAPFEIMTADERFLAQARDMETSPLDRCHYRVSLRPLVPE